MDHWCSTRTVGGRLPSSSSLGLRSQPPRWRRYQHLLLPSLLSSCPSSEVHPARIVSIAPAPVLSLPQTSLPALLPQLRPTVIVPLAHRWGVQRHPLESTRPLSDHEVQIAGAGAEDPDPARLPNFASHLLGVAGSHLFLGRWFVPIRLLGSTTRLDVSQTILTTLCAFLFPLRSAHRHISKSQTQSVRRLRNRDIAKRHHKYHPTEQPHTLNKELGVDNGEEIEGGGG